MQQKHSKGTPKQSSIFTDGVAHLHNSYISIYTVQLFFHHFLTIGHLIVYGVKETISNVDPSVYDTAFVIENGKMVMETDLSLNGHNLSGSVHYIHGYLSTKNDKTIFELNGNSQVLIPANSNLLSATVLFKKITGPFPAITLRVIGGGFPLLRFTSTKAIQKQKIDINLKLPNGIFSVFLLSPKFKYENFLILIEYREP